MRLLAWIMTVAFALAGVALREQGGFALASWVGQGCLILATLACPLLWQQPAGLIPALITVGGRSRLMLGLALVFAAPLLLPWS